MDSNILNMKYSKRDIVIIIFITIMTLGILVASIFLIKVLAKKADFEPLLVYDNENNVIAKFEKKNCNKKIYKAGDFIMITNSNNVPIKLELTKDLVIILNKYCSSEIDLFSYIEDFSNKIYIKNIESINNLKLSFDVSSLSINPIHPYLYGYKQENVLKKYIKQTDISLPHKLIGDKTSKRLYIKFTEFIRMNEIEITNFEDIIDVKNKFVQRQIKAYPDNYRVLKMLYNDWYNYYSGSFDDVYCTLKLDNYSSDILNFENEEDLRVKKEELLNENIENDNLKMFYKYTLQIEDNQNDTFYFKYLEYKKKLSKFLNLCREFDVSDKRLEQLRMFTNNILIVNDFKYDIEKIRVLEKSLVDPDDLDLYFNLINIQELYQKLPNSLKTIHNNYYSVRRDSNSNLKIHFLGYQQDNSHFIKSKNYFVNNIKYFTRSSLMETNFSFLSEIKFGLEDEPINFSKLECIDIKAFLKYDALSKAFSFSEQIIKFEFHINDVSPNFRFYNSLDSLGELKQLNLDKIKDDEFVKAGCKVVFYKEDYTFVNNIYDEIRIGDKNILQKNKIMLNFFKSINQKKNYLRGDDEPENIYIKAFPNIIKLTYEKEDDKLLNIIDFNDRRIA